MRKHLTATLLAASLTATTAIAGPPVAPVISSQSVAADATKAEVDRGLIAALAFSVILVAISAGSAPAPVPSDSRLKTDIAPVGTAPNGLTLYNFRYKGSDALYQGVMAQDVLAHTPEAVVTMANGYYAVNYDMLGLEMTRID
ncbi:MAG: tail fiber domain-containing protein [Pseudopelagicola sp.]|nr:tail fiber domain-containing protein [Pseudopelagicola sp.]